MAQTADKVAEELISIAAQDQGPCVYDEGEGYSIHGDYIGSGVFEYWVEDSYGFFVAQGLATSLNDLRAALVAMLKQWTELE